MEALISQIVGLISSAIIIYIAFGKDIRRILIGEFCVNFTVALTYFLLRAYLGALLCVVATVHTFISYAYKKREKSFPIVLTVLFCAIYVALGIVGGEKLLDYLPTVCSVLFAFAIIQKNPPAYNIFNATKSAVWVVYDIFIGAYTTAFAHFFVFVSAIVAIATFNKRKK